MEIHTPHDSKYTALVGTAVYVFAYYEWAVIYLIEQFNPGFVSRYSRGKPMTSGKVLEKFEAILNDPGIVYTAVSKSELQGCLEKFGQLIEKRNALIHAHPVTDHDGSQILNYQTHPSRLLPDFKWEDSQVEDALKAFDEAACEANGLLHRLLK